MSGVIVTQKRSVSEVCECVMGRGVLYVGVCLSVCYGYKCVSVVHERVCMYAVWCVV